MKAALVVAVCVAAGCHEARTEMVVVVNDADLVVGADFDALSIDVRAENQHSWQLSRTRICSRNETPRQSPPECLTFPVVFSLYPGPTHPTDQVTIDVIAWRGGLPVIDDAAQFSFVSGKSERLDITLYASCLANGTRCARQTPPASCGPAGDCVMLPTAPLGGDPGLDASVVYADDGGGGGHDLAGVGADGGPPGSDGGGWKLASTAFRAGGVSAVAVDPNSARIGYAGSVGGGVFVTMDSGATWSSASEGLPGGAVAALAISPANSLQIYAAIQGDGIYVSKDGAKTWRQKSMGLPGGPPSFTALAVSPMNASIAYAAVGMVTPVVTTNDGDTWTPITTGLAASQMLQMAVGSAANQVFAAVPGSGILQWNGVTWSIYGVGLPNANVQGVAIDSSGVVYAGSVFTGSPPVGGIFKCTGSSATWTQVTPVGDNALSFSTLAVQPGTSTLIAGVVSHAMVAVSGSTVSDISGSPSYASSVSLSSMGLVLGASSSGLYAGTLSGMIRDDTGFAREAVFSVAATAANPRLLLAGAYSSVYSSTDHGVTFGAYNEGSPGQGLALAIQPDAGKAWLAGGTNGVWSRDLTQSASSWTLAPGPAATPMISVGLDPAMPSRIYAASSSSGFYTALFPGTLMPANTGLPSNLLESLAVGSDGTIWVGDFGLGLYRSTDHGASFSLAATNGFDHGLNAMYVRSIGIAPSNPSIVYAGTGNVPPLFCSKNALSPSAWNSCPTPFNNPVTAIVVDPSDPMVVYVGAADLGIYKSTNGGMNWSLLSSGLASKNISGLAMEPDAPYIMYAATSGGLYRTSSGGL